MPIYEYRCKSCGHPFELLVRADTVVACPHCASRKVDKQFSAFSARMNDGTSSACERAEAGQCCPGCPSGGCMPAGG